MRLQAPAVVTSCHAFKGPFKTDIPTPTEWMERQGMDGV